jgi:hypothetical protein
LRAAANELGRQSVPSDAGDFGRCSRLLARFPEWRANLVRVAEAYPDTKWPAIIARWDEVESADTATFGNILNGI